MRQKEKTVLIAVNGENENREDIKDVFRCRDSLSSVFLKKGIEANTLYIYKDDFKDFSSFKKKLTVSRPYCIFNLFEGFGDDSRKEAEFAKILEKANLPFTGNSSFTLRTCVDKIKTKNLLRRNAIPAPKGVFVRNIRDFKIGNLTFPLFIKPCCEDSSLGINYDSLVGTKDDLFKVLNKSIKQFPEGLILEEFLPGKEYSVSFLGGSSSEPIGISVTDYSKHKNLPPFFTYASKWELKNEEYKQLIPEYNVKIENRLKKEITRIAKLTSLALGCKSYFRIDLRQKDEYVFVIDVNPNPDLNIDSGYMKQAYERGYSYDEVVCKIIKLARINS